MEIILSQSEISVGDHPGMMGGKILRFTTPQGITITAILDENACKIVAAQLTSGLIIASGPLAAKPPIRN